MSLSLEERPLPCSKSATRTPEADLEIALGLEDLLLRELQERRISMSLKDLQTQISPTRPVKDITVAASLDRLCRKGRVIKRLVVDTHTHYVYSSMSRASRSMASRF